MTYCNYCAIRINVLTLCETEEYGIQAQLSGPIPVRTWDSHVPISDTLEKFTIRGKRVDQEGTASGSLLLLKDSRSLLIGNG